MKISVRDPSVGVVYNLEAKPENYLGLHGFRIFHENGSNFFIANRSGTWRSGDDHHINPDFLINIGLALEGAGLNDQTSPNT